MWKGHFLALQFHLDAAAGECDQFLQFSGSDLAKVGPRVQTASSIVKGAQTYSDATGALLYKILDQLFARQASPFTDLAPAVESLAVPAAMKGL